MRINDYKVHVVGWQKFSHFILNVTGSILILLGFRRILYLTAL